MNQQNKTVQLEDERRVEKEYQKVLAQRAKTIAQYEGPVNALIVGKRLPPRRVYGNTIAGRVALVAPDQDLLDGDNEFYIGETYAVVDGVNVFSWATAIARTFYQGGQRHYEGAENSYRGPERHYLCNQVAAVRAFRHVDGRIVNFIDEPRCRDAPAQPFASRGRLNIPAPPSLPKLPVPGAPKPSAQPDQSDVAETPAGAADVVDGLPPVRAEELLREQLLAPRQASLTPVLSTLQPDQYELVTMTGQHSVIIEGHPGTGKTIVATHRAAYLVHDDIPDEDRLTGNILVVGPTPGYSRHVRGVISRLAGPTNRIAVFSLPELADLIIGRSEAPPMGVSRSYHDVGWEIARFARSVIAKFRADAGRNPSPAEVIDTLKSRAGILAANDKEWATYLRGLPDYRAAAKLRVHSPLIAFIHWELRRPEAFARVEHVIVDEAQDVTPLEWLLLDEINEGDKWTLIGDLNQRRSDHTLPDWNQVLDHIAIEPDTPVRRMRRGYRSTKPILDFANRLLPQAERKINAFQQIGPEPRITGVRTSKELGDAVAQEVDRLLVEYPKGTLAVICQTGTAATSGLRKRGWSADSVSLETWFREGREVKVLTPDAARGLEFDAVIVVEPAQFPKNFGRFGPLYTALTRANRELSVVHSQKLPRELLKRWPPIRAEAPLRDQMLAPRAKSLSPVLSTLQPDQFELVAVPAIGSIIIEGQPGTGKTIIASHRAAYLVNEDTPLEKKVLGKVLVVGPTHGYSNRVRPLIARLAGNSNKIIVLSLAELSELIVGAKQRQELGSSSEYPRLPAQLAKVVRSAVVRRTDRSLANRPVRPFQVYEYLRSSDDITRLHPKWTSYRWQLPPYREALSAQAYAPLITFIHWEIEKPDELRNVHHVIVDEAQDLTPLDWVLLDEINVAHHWTILGDLNQRRINGTPASWREMLEPIKIPRDTPVRTMRRANRSTRPILEYANQLVPRAQRQVFAFQQDGPYPNVHQVRESDLGNFAAKELERLSDTYPSGTVVAICQTPGIITVWLRLSGWINDAGECGVWTKNGRSVSVFVPDAIRGLEFDGVVVVEPARFPTQHGCLGMLYTALTRANREVSLVQIEARGVV